MHECNNDFTYACMYVYVFDCDSLVVVAAAEIVRIKIFIFGIESAQFLCVHMNLHRFAIAFNHFQFYSSLFYLFDSTI